MQYRCARRRPPRRNEIISRVGGGGGWGGGVGWEEGGGITRAHRSAVASTLAFRTLWLISHGRLPKKRFASAGRGFFLCSRTSLAPTRALCPLGPDALARGNMCHERVGYLIKIGLSWHPVRAPTEKDPFARLSLWDFGRGELSIRRRYPPTASVTNSLRRFRDTGLLASSSIWLERDRAPLSPTVSARDARHSREKGDATLSNFSGICDGLPESKLRPKAAANLSMMKPGFVLSVGTGHSTPRAEFNLTHASVITSGM